MKIKIAHLISVHPRNDVRVFWKECISLEENNFEVYLVVADGKENETLFNINIVNSGNNKINRISRMFFLPGKVYKAALELDCSLFHIHDPELLRIGYKLHKVGKKVIYDIHEDLPKAIMSKSYIKRIFRKPLSFFIKIIENYYAKKMDYLITATSSIEKRFKSINYRTKCIYNFPLKKEISEKLLLARNNEICYIGDISKIRGILELVKSIENTNCILNLAGNFESEELKNQVMNLPGWSKVNYLGFLSRLECSNIRNRSRIGILLFHPEPNHIEAQPNKIFEYMADGLPILASNFPLWKQIVEDNNCGICVDPYNHFEISEAINYLVENENIAIEMGENGRKAIVEKFNWETEENKLIMIYNELLEH